MNADAVAALRAFLTECYERGLDPDDPEISAVWVAALAAAPLPSDTDRLSIALQRAGALSPSHMTYHDLARCLLAALTDGRDDLGSPDEHDRHMATPLPSDTPADGLDAREFRFTTWDGSSLVVTVDDEDPGDIGEPRMVEDYDDATSYISVAALALTKEPRSGDDR